MKFLRVLIFAIFSTIRKNKFPQKNYSATLNVFILNYLTTYVVCHLECVYSKLPHLSAILNVFILN